MKIKKQVLNTLTIIILTLFTAALIVTTVLQTRPQNAEQLQEERDEISTYVDGEAAEQNKVYSMPKALTYRSAQPFEAVTLRVTVLPENADNKSIDFKAEFKDPNSAWASGKSVSDYFRYEQAEEGGTEVRVRCMNPFGEQIIFTAMSRSNPEVTATCTVDYAQSIKSVKFGLMDGSNATTIPLGNSALNAGRYETTVDVGAETGGAGGKITLDYRTDDVYTVPLGNVTETVTFSGGGICVRNSTNYTTYALNSIFDALGKEIRFDRSIFREYAGSYFDTSSGTNKSWYSDALDLKSFYENIYGGEDAYKTLFNITVEISGDSFTYTGYSKIIWSGCTVSVKSLSIDKAQVALTLPTANPFA